MKTILTCLLIVLTSISYSLSIANEIGSVSCDYTILSNGNPLEVKKQLLIQRAETNERISNTDNASYGTGLAYTEWHLKFVCGKNVSYREREAGEGRNLSRTYKVQFMDKDKVVLSNSFVTSDKLNLWKGGTEDDPMYAYSLNLIGLPFVFLDDVKFVDIVLVDCGDSTINADTQRKHFTVYS